MAGTATSFGHLIRHLKNVRLAGIEFPLNPLDNHVVWVSTMIARAGTITFRNFYISRSGHNAVLMMSAATIAKNSPTKQAMNVIGRPFVVAHR